MVRRIAVDEMVHHAICVPVCTLTYTTLLLWRWEPRMDSWGGQAPAAPDLRGQATRGSGCRTLQHPEGVHSSLGESHAWRNANLRQHTLRQDHHPGCGALRHLTSVSRARFVFSVRRLNVKKWGLGGGDAGKFSLNPIMYSLYSLLVSTFLISRLISCHTIYFYVSCIQLSISASRYFFWLTFERRITCTITMINYCQMWLSSQTMVTRMLCPIHRFGHSCHHHQPYWRNVVVPPYVNAPTDNSSAIDVINWSNWSLSWCCYIKWNEMNFV